MFYMSSSQEGGIFIVRTCAFIGHRNVNQTVMLKKRLKQIITTIIVKDNVDTFLFGSKSAFNDLCYTAVSELKQLYPHVRRVFVRVEWDNDNMDYIAAHYEETLCPDKVRGAGRKSYILRNEEMIDMCDILVAYCDMNYTPTTMTKSGTIMATEYARKKKKQIINLFEN